MLLPLLLLTFTLIAGWVATEYGTHYLFRDNEPRMLLEYLGRCGDHRLPCILTSARFHTALYATSLMGMVWTLFVLIERRDRDTADRHPISRFEPVLPGVVLLGLVMVIAILLNRNDPERTYEVLILSGLGFVSGLLFVGLVTWLGMLLSLRLRCHQVLSFLALSILVGLVVAVLPVNTPSKAIFIALAFAVVVYCGFEIATAQYRSLLAAVIILVLIIGTSLPTFKYTFSGLERQYDDWPLQQLAVPVTGASAPAPLLKPEAALEAWHKLQGNQGAAARKKIVVVAASGGAYRATFWTAKVLDNLIGNSKLPGIQRSHQIDDWGFGRHGGSGVSRGFATAPARSAHRSGPLVRAQRAVAWHRPLGGQAQRRGPGARRPGRAGQATLAGKFANRTLLPRSFSA